jgi:hypothetical protein
MAAPSTRRRVLSVEPGIDLRLTLEQKGNRKSRPLLHTRFRVYPLLRPGDDRRRTRAYTKATNGQEVRQKTFDTLELLQSILIHLSAKQLYGVQCVSTQFRRAVLSCPLIRDKMFLNRTIRPHETWKAVEGGHGGIQFRSIGHWLFLHRPDPAGPMHRVLAPSDPSPHSLRTFTPAILHPIFLDGPWDTTARNEALRSAPPAWLNGSQRWVSAVMLPVIAKPALQGAKSVILDAWTSDPPCEKANIRVSYEMKSGVFRSRTCCIRSEKGLKLRHVYNALDELSLKLYREVTVGNAQMSIRKELKIFMPCDIHPVTSEEWSYVKSLRGDI